MYAALWNALPKPTWLRVAICAVLLGIAFLLLMTVVYPYLETHVPWMQVTVE